MKTILKEGKFNCRIEPSDWRYSASIVGLVKYFDYCASVGQFIDYNMGHDVLEYNTKDVTEEQYFLFVEYYFEDDMHHRLVEQILSTNTPNKEQIKLVNEKLKSNTIMKKVFKNMDCNDENKKEILEKINKNRLSIIKETYRNGKKLYANFSNVKSLLQETGKVCRLINYNIDMGKKSKSTSFNWNHNTYNYKDEIEFDFIPFAFSKSREAFFINNNYSIEQLINTNNLIRESNNPRSTLFNDFKDSAKFIDFDVEVIIKNRSNDYFETLYIRKEAVKIFEKINNYKAIQINYKVNDNYFLNFEKEVTNNILNKVKLDRLIEILLKSQKNYGYSISTMIGINILVYGGDKVDKQMKSAYASAKNVMKCIPENKIKSYKQKLTSSIIFKDYEGFCEILLQLSSYSGVVFSFAYDLFKDFEDNKNIAYTFINALNISEKNNPVAGGDN